MRDVRYLSPTSVAKFFDDRTEFYLRYIAEHRPPRIKQSQPMAVGAAFDAYLKSYIVDKLFGGGRPEFELATIFETQVEPHNRNWAKIAGLHCFEQYKSSGALADLLVELALATHEPRLEFTVEDTVRINDMDIPLLGKPDIYFVVEGGSHVIPDFKVNGYCGKRATSPKPGYVMCRGSWGRGNGGAHKDAQVMRIDGINVNIATTLEQINEDWARQLSIYAWILGESVGSQFIAGIEQLACKPGPPGEAPLIRIASHRCRISKEYQKKVADMLTICWTAITTKHIFTDLSVEDNKARCELLDEYYRAFEGDANDPNEKWFREITRELSNF